MRGSLVGSCAGDFSFVDDAGDPMPGFHTQVPVRICMPITQGDLDAADGGIDGVHIVHVTGRWGVHSHSFRQRPEQHDDVRRRR